MAAAVRSRPGSAVGQYAYSATGPPASPPAVGGRAGAGTGVVLAVISVNGRFGPVVESASEAAWDSRAEALRICAEKLSEKDRALLRRRYEQDTPIDQIAWTMNGTVGG